MIPGFQGVTRRWPHHHARPRRVGHLGGRDRGGGQGRPLRHLHRRRRGLHHRPAHRRQGAQAQVRHLRGNARTGLGRGQGAADPLGQPGDEGRRARAGAHQLHRRRRPAGRRLARHDDRLGRGNGRIWTWNANWSPASPTTRTRPRSSSPACPTSRARWRTSSPRWPTPSINVDMIIQNVGRDKGETDVTFTVPQADLARTQALLEDKRGEDRLQPHHHRQQGRQDQRRRRRHEEPRRRRRDDVQGARRPRHQHPGDLAPARSRSRVLIDEDETELAVRVLHTAYGLDAEDVAA